MYIKRVFVKGISHLSYVVGVKKKCIVVDPRRDTDIYIDIARDMGYEIKYILQTHLHADFISGHIDLAKKIGATIICPKAAACEFDNMAVSQGDEVKFETLKIKVIETPGHTPEHVSYVFYDESRSKDPAAIFTGDTLFVGDVGRPDLFPGKADELSKRLFESLKKILELPDFVEVYPAHSAGSLCGKMMSMRRSSTIGYERRNNKALILDDFENFKKNLLLDMPEPPDHFKRCSKENAKGPIPINQIKEPRPLKPNEFYDFIDNNALVLDVRNTASYGGQHIPNSINIDKDTNFSTFAGWILSSKVPVLIVSQCYEDVKTSIIKLRRVGIDKIEGWLDGGIQGWALEGYPVSYIPQISVNELREIISKGKINLLDVRSKKEYEKMHVNGFINIPFPDLRYKFEQIREPIACMCSSGQRSSLATSILRSKGIKEVFNIPGGLTGWQAINKRGDCPLCPSSHGPQF